MSRLLPSAVALSLIALASCSGSSIDAQTGTATEAAIVYTPTRVIVPPRFVRWEDRDTTTPLWRTDVESAVVVIGPSSSSLRFIAYGVDTRRDRVVWTFDVLRTEKHSFLAEEGRQYRATTGFDNEATHCVIGTVYGPGPSPPQPGQPPGLRSLHNALTAAAQIDDAIEASKAAVYE